MEQMFTDALDKLLSDHCTSEVVRNIEDSGNASAIWQMLEESGFGNVLLSEDHGGAGLILPQVYCLFELCGKVALPVPLAETMIARQVINNSGERQITEAVTMAEGSECKAGSITSHVAYGAVSELVLMQAGASMRLLSMADAQVSELPFALDCIASWPLSVWHKADVVSCSTDVRTLMACVASARLAGGMLTVLDQSIKYAGEREQFGRPLSKFQALQHMLSVSAEQVYSSRMAAMIGCNSSGWLPDRASVAIAKANTSSAAYKVVADAHALHGAIGFTEEFDLQIYTRRLNRDRLLMGSESYWYDQAGAWLLHNNQGSSLDAIIGFNV